jgi:hypothetical protein
MIGSPRRSFFRTSSSHSPRASVPAVIHRHGVASSPASGKCLHTVIPFREIILAEAEDRLHRIAENGRRQGIRGETDERMLPAPAEDTQGA